MYTHNRCLNESCDYFRCRYSKAWADYLISMSLCLRIVEIENIAENVAIKFSNAHHDKDNIEAMLCR